VKKLEDKYKNVFAYMIQQFGFQKDQLRQICRLQARESCRIDIVLLEDFVQAVD
jgi:hypothetical protein